MDATLSTAYTYVVPWLNILSAWPNTAMGGLAIVTSPTELQITQMSQSGQPMVVLAVNFDVLTEFNIPLV